MVDNDGEVCGTVKTSAQKKKEKKAKQLRKLKEHKGEGEALRGSSKVQGGQEGGGEGGYTGGGR